MSDLANQPMFPAVNITVGPAPSAQVVVLQLDYITGPMHAIESATKGPIHALTIPQAEYLAQKIVEAVQILKKSGTPGAQGQTVQ